MQWISQALFLLLSLSQDTSEAHRITDSLRIYKGQQVVVTGTRNEIRHKDSPVRVEVIDQRRIATTAMVSLNDLVKEQTGLLLSGGIRTGVQMNGLGPDYTLILIDGQPIIGRVAGVIDLSRISVGNIDRVEVVKGPMSSMYGSEALAGVINIITKRPEALFAGSLFVQGQTNGPLDVRLESSYGADSLEISTFIDYKNSQSFTKQFDTVNVPYAAYQDGTAQAKVLWRIDNHWKLKSWLRAFGSKSNGEFVESVLGQVATNKGSVEQYDVSSTIGTEYTSGRARLNLTAYGSLYNERYNFDVEQGSGGTIDDVQRRIARLYAQYDLLFGESNRMTVGGEYIYDDISGTRYSDSANPDQTSLYRTVVAFAQWEGLPNDWISYVLSARFDGNNVYGEAFSPRFSLLFKPGEHVRLSGSVGTGFKAPDFRQLYVVFSNRLPGAGYDLIGAARLGNTLEAERSVSYDVGVRYEDGRRDLGEGAAILYSADVRAFRNDLTDLIEYYLYGTIDGRNVYSYRNLSRVYTQGIEANAAFTLVVHEVGSFTCGLGYQFLDANDVEVLDAIDNGMAGTIDDPLTLDEYGGLWNRSRNSGVARIQFDSPDNLWSTNVRAQFVGRYGDESLDVNGIVISDPPRKVLDDPNEYVQGYTVLNTALTKTFVISDSSRWMLGVAVNNILNVFNPTLIAGLVGIQYSVQTSLTW